MSTVPRKLSKSGKKLRKANQKIHNGHDSEPESLTPDPAIEDLNLGKAISVENLRKRRTWLEVMRSKATSLGRVPGTLLNQLVKAGMQTPIVKYLMSPHTLNKALNNDPILRETYRIILTSEPVRNLLTLQAFKIILDEDTAKKVITPQLVLQILNMDLVANFMTPEFVRFLLQSVMEHVFTPEAVLDNMESKTAKAFLTPEVMHEIAYSRFFTMLMDPDFYVKFLNTSGVKKVMTEEAINDALDCPGAERTMNQETIDKVLGTEGFRNLLAHPGFNEQVGRIFQTIMATKF